MEPESGKVQDTLILVRFSGARQKGHLAEGNGAEIIA